MLKILLVEDNEMNRDMLSRRLARRGFEVLVAVDGQQGVESALREQPDLVLMDMSLPVMDGWTATSTIKNDAQTAHIPVIALLHMPCPETRRRRLRQAAMIMIPSRWTWYACWTR